MEHRGRELFISANENGSRPPLIMIHVWPEERQRFEVLAKHVSTEQPLYGILCPTEDVVGGIRRAQDWTAFMHSAVVALPLKPPYNIFGWSIGGVVALEVARALGDNVSFVGMIDTWMPRNYNPLHRVLFVLNRLALQPRGPSMGHLRFFLKKEVRAERRALAHIDDYLTEQSRRLTGSPRASVQDVLEWKTFFEFRRFVLRPVTQPVTFFSAVETKTVQGIDASWDWARLFVGGFQVVRLDAGHWTIWDDPFIETLARALEQAVVRN